MKKMGIIIACLVFLCGCKEKLYIYNWAYYTPESVIEKFEKEFDVSVKYDEFNSNEEMYAKLKAGGKGYDIVFPTGDFVSIMINQDMFEKIDKSLVPNIVHIDPLVLERTTYDPEMEYSVPYYFGAAGVVVNTSKVPVFEESWSIFARDDLRNRMTMLDDMREVMGAALSFLGYSVNSKDTTHLLAAQNLINNSWKPNLVKFDAESFGKGYANGDFWVVHGYPENVFEEIFDNPALIRDTYFYIPKEGGSSYIDSMCILKGSKKVELAHKFINFIHRPEIYAEFADEWGFPATVNVPARLLKTGESWYTYEELLDTELKEDLGPDLDVYNNIWFNSIRAGQ
ncbi:MAG: extracellular solute-binding protein [Treponema sp.]|nr:extracellular solute-binding protein [Treponema sp.]